MIQSQKENQPTNTIDQVFGYPYVPIPMDLSGPSQTPYERRQNFVLSTHTINLQYYEEFKKLYFTSYCISTQLRKITKTKEDLLSRLEKIERQLPGENDKKQELLKINKKKRFRRTTDQIQRKFHCDAQRCGKVYASEGSLQQHIKLKHPDLCEKKQF